MGSGKSTIGKRLANKLGYTFIDLDKEIEEVQNKTINELFEEGEAQFRVIEAEQLRTASLNNQQFVMALGGGTPCFNDNMEFINSNGTSIYLKYNIGVLFSRLKNAKEERPLLKDKSDDELLVYIEEKLMEREDFYKKCSLTIESKNLTVEEMLGLF